MKKRKLLTFKGLTKFVKLKIKDKVVNLREERLLVISRSPTGIDISGILARDEFSVVLHALFNNEGKMIKCTDEAAFLRGIEDITFSDHSAIRQSIDPA